ncbi:MAG TPA: HNH endonuclease [Candidatus Brocadiales bacterium]|nr:HNH endonuclease [Candidatus Brocadiales bacterium]
METASSLDASVLVLNKFFMAMNVVSVRRAFTLLYKNSAEVVLVDEEKFASYTMETWKDVSLLKTGLGLPEEDYDWIRSVSLEIPAPRIIRHLFYDKVPRWGIKFNRRNIFARDENRCQYCGCRFSTYELSLDHITPRSRGGKTSWTNVVCACTECNKRKGGRTPDEAGIKLIRKPFVPKHSPILTLKLNSGKYRSWKQFLDHAYWSVPLK